MNWFSLKASWQTSDYQVQGVQVCLFELKTELETRTLIHLLLLVITLSITLTSKNSIPVDKN